MKTQKLITLILLALITVSYSQQPIDNALARVSKSNNKFIFCHNEPVNEYEQAFTFENVMPSNCTTVKEMMSISVQHANQEAGNQSRIYDAIIITDGARDIAITWKDKAKDNAIACVPRNEGKYVFEGCEPVSNYDIAGKFDVSGALQQLTLGTCPTEAEKISKLIKKSEKSKLNFDAVIFGVSELDLAIKFK